MDKNLKSNIHEKEVAIVGGGLSGMSAALELARAGIKVTIYEAEAELGGLAGSFAVEGANLEKFYHHWFNSDKHILELIEELGETQRVKRNHSQTGMYYANKFFKLSSPLDLIRLTSLTFLARIRLGLATLYVQNIQDWKALENFTAAEWLPKIFGQETYNVIWKPLLIGKFGTSFKDVSAVWFWNKIKLRGGSRGKKGKEELLYYQGGFQVFIDRLKTELLNLGVEIKQNTKINSVKIIDDTIDYICDYDDNSFRADSFLFALPPPLIGDILARSGANNCDLDSYYAVPYLANVCLVLQLTKKLSDLYWINVNDPAFPFVAFIEHTNFEDPVTYNDKTLVYLSKYLSPNDPLYKMDAKQLTKFSVPYIKKMFPDFNEVNVEAKYLWKERFAQPIIVTNYSEKKPTFETTFSNLFYCHMTHIYPEDRGTNYAVREGRKVGKLILASLTKY